MCKINDNKILDFIYQSKWYECRKEVHRQDLEKYGINRKSINDDVYTARWFLDGYNVGQLTVLQLDLNNLRKEFLGINIVYKIDTIIDSYQTREQMVNGWY